MLRGLIRADSGQCGWCKQRWDSQKVPDAIGEGSTRMVLCMESTIGVEASCPTC